MLNTQSDNLRVTMFYGPLFVSILAGIMLAMSMIVALKSFCRNKDCLVMMMSCSTNNGTFACASTILTAFLFFYLLLFVEALNETNADIDFVHGELEDDKPWANVGLFEKLFNSEKLYKTYLLRETNVNGELCLTCHHADGYADEIK